jgi:hypothetical protein
MQITGACHCGQITFTADIDPSGVMVCHCTDCQVLAGSAFRVVVVAPIASFSVRGAPKRYVKVAQAGNRRAQMFCPECGTPLYACSPEHPQSVSIRLGCFQERAQLNPSSQIWSHSAMPWLAELSSVPSSPEQQALLAGRPL